VLARPKEGEALGSEHLWRVKLGARTAMAAGGSVHARGEARAAFIDRALACNDRMILYYCLMTKVDWFRR
jgi:hypothetical protein